MLLDIHDIASHSAFVACSYMMSAFNSSFQYELSDFGVIWARQVFISNVHFAVNAKTSQQTSQTICKLLHFSYWELFRRFILLEVHIQSLFFIKKIPSYGAIWKGFILMRRYCFEYAKDTKYYSTKLL